MAENTLRSEPQLDSAATLFGYLNEISCQYPQQLLSAARKTQTSADMLREGKVSLATLSSNGAIDRLDVSKFFPAYSSA